MISIISRRRLGFLDIQTEDVGGNDLNSSGSGKIRIRKLIAAIITASLIGAVYCISAFSSTVTRSIPSVRITVVTGNIDFDDGLEDTPEDYVKVPDNSYYTLDSAEWVDDVSTIKPGSTPKILVRLEAIPKETSHSNYDLIYLFRGSYTSSNVSVTKGTFVKSEVKDSGYYLEVTLTMNAMNGKYDTPANADWISPTGTASWTENTIDSGYHDLICYRGSTKVKELKNYHGTSYNFYPYITKEGTYKYKIRTVADPSNGTGRTSDWLESGELYISTSEVSDGTGQTTADENGSGNSAVVVSDGQYPNGTGNSVTYGWIEQNGNTYFIYPDGTLLKSGWIKLDGKWYMFDDSGRRVTGWNKNKYGKWFYMDPSTAVMKIGWLKDNGYWYFLNTTEGDNLGSMVTGWLTWNGEKYYFNDSGIMVTGWYKVDGYYRYFYPEGSKDGAYGYMARNTTTAGFTFDENGIWK